MRIHYRMRWWIFLLQMLTGHQMVAYNQLDTKWCPIKPDMR